MEFEDLLLDICRVYEINSWMPTNLKKKFRSYLEIKKIRSISNIITLWIIGSALVSILTFRTPYIMLGLSILFTAITLISGLYYIATLHRKLLGGFIQTQINEVNKINQVSNSAWYDNINLTIYNKYAIYSHFTYENGKFKFNKKIELYKNNNLVVKRYISRDENGVLIFINDPVYARQDNCIPE